MKIPAKMAEQRSGVDLAPAVPLWRHFDVMAALCFVMCGSCQISGPVTAQSACLLALTESVMELRLNKRGYHPPRTRPALLFHIRGGEGRRRLPSRMLREEEEESSSPFSQR